MRSQRIITFFACVLVSAAGCYTGHAVGPDKLSAFSNEIESGIIDVETEEGGTVQVGPETGVLVTDIDGLKHPIQPFAFKVSSTQLVAPEQDLILPLDTIELIEVMELSTVGTLGLVGLGIGTAGAMAATVLLSAEEPTGF
jgi:hypothetical protein